MRNKILIVDDNSKNIQVLASILSEEGYNVEYALSGANALQLVENENFDLILLDIMMPVMDGYEACLKIKEQDKNKDLPIIFLTAKTDSASIEKAFKCGGVDYLTKPFNFDELLARVKTHVTLKTSKDKLAKSLEKEKELNQLKSRFVSTVSHQFRTPLTIIGSAMDVLNLHKEKMNENYTLTFDRIFNKVIGQIDLMTNLMDEVLSLSKINSGQIELYKEQVDLTVICNEIINDYNSIQEDMRKMTLEIVGESKMLDLDVTTIKNAISNLISNAFKYSQDKPAPKMTLIFTDKSIKIDVQDHGIGLTEFDEHKVFDSFYRAENAFEINGTGLGLSIAKEYFQLNSFSLDVICKPEMGTIFTAEYSLT